MKIATRVAWMLPALAVVVLVAAPTAYARDGMDDSTQPSTSSTGSGSNSGSGSSGGGGHSASVEDEQEEAGEDNPKTGTRVKLEDAKKDFQDRMRSKSNSLLDEAKKQKKQAATAEERQQKCEARKQGLDQKLANMIKNAQKYQTRVDNVFAKAQAYKTDNNVTIDNWDALVATATDAQTKAKASVDVLSTLTTTVDCNKETVASGVATFKAAVAQAREDLKAYRKSVKDIVKAIEQAQEAAATTSTTTNQEGN